MRGRTAGVLIGSLIATFVIGSPLAACSNNGEGERCDFDNGNEDCSNGLVCVPATAQGNRGAGYGTVNPPYNSSDRCCPLPRTGASHPACVLGGSTGADAAPTPPTPSTDGGDASSSSDGASDAPTDAPDAG